MCVRLPAWASAYVPACLPICYCLPSRLLLPACFPDLGLRLHTEAHACLLLPACLHAPSCYCLLLPVDDEQIKKRYLAARREFISAARNSAPALVATNKVGGWQ